MIINLISFFNLNRVNIEVLFLIQFLRLIKFRTLNLFKKFTITQWHYASSSFNGMNSNMKIAKINLVFWRAHSIKQWLFFTNENYQLWMKHPAPNCVFGCKILRGYVFPSKKIWMWNEEFIHAIAQQQHPV